MYHTERALIPNCSQHGDWRRVSVLHGGAHGWISECGREGMRRTPSAKFKYTDIYWWRACHDPSVYICVIWVYSFTVALGAVKDPSFTGKETAAQRIDIIGNWGLVSGGQSLNPALPAPCWHNLPHTSAFQPLFLGTLESPEGGSPHRQNRKRRSEAENYTGRTRLCYIYMWNWPCCMLLKYKRHISHSPAPTFLCPLTSIQPKLSV